MSIWYLYTKYPKLPQFLHPLHLDHLVLAQVQLFQFTQALQVLHHSDPIVTQLEHLESGGVSVGRGQEIQVRGPLIGGLKDQEDEVNSGGQEVMSGEEVKRLGQ